MGCGECGQPLHSEDWLRDLLAIIHGDGGHHTADVGLEASFTEGIKIAASNKARVAELETVALWASAVCQRGQCEGTVANDEIFNLACALTAAGVPSPTEAQKASESSGQ